MHGLSKPGCQRHRSSCSPNVYLLCRTIVYIRMAYPFNPPCLQDSGPGNARDRLSFYHHASYAYLSCVRSCNLRFTSGSIFKHSYGSNYNSSCKNNHCWGVLCCCDRAGHESEGSKHCDGFLLFVSFDQTRHIDEHPYNQQVRLLHITVS